MKQLTFGFKFVTLSVVIIILQLLLNIDILFTRDHSVNLRQPRKKTKKDKPFGTPTEEGTE